MTAGGNPISLVHPGEIMIICGIGLGILVVSSPKSVLVGLKVDLIKAFKGGIASKDKFIDLLVLLYELFMLGRRKGTPALDEHVSDPQNSSIFTKYPSFLNDAGLVEFLCNSLRPIVDGRCKPAEIGGILKAELNSREAEAGRSIKAIEMIADALPGVGIVAASAELRLAAAGWCRWFGGCQLLARAGTGDDLAAAMAAQPDHRRPLRPP